MRQQQEHNDFDSGIGREVEEYLRGLHAADGTDNGEDSDAEGSTLGQPQPSPAYDEVKQALEQVFTLCEQHGFSIQVAFSDDPLDEQGEQGRRITVCGHLHPQNVPCEMLAAAAVYQSNHIFSHMVIALAHTAAQLIMPDQDEEE